MAAPENHIFRKYPADDDRAKADYRKPTESEQRRRERLLKIEIMQEEKEFEELWDSI